MLRMRRYRVFLAFAFISAFVLVRYGQSKNWRTYGQTPSIVSTKPKQDDSGRAKAGTNPQKDVGADRIHGENTISTVATIPQQTADLALKEKQSPARQPTRSVGADATKLVDAAKPKVTLPDKKLAVPDKKTLESPTAQEFQGIDPVDPPGRVDTPDAPPIPTIIRWKKQEEHFPVPANETIHLPTGTPPKIPLIQHQFGKEEPAAKKKREEKLAIIKKEFLKAWKSYKEHAWKHDELAPVSAEFKDPFCGWAATLVDSLDTLWIMGLKDEFEEAVKAVNELDFTTTKRPDIPVFETTIRYLGGLLAAYDISGQEYRNILDKAVELGDILIGAFDTPNRMPMLFYRWKPTFASQPHRAGKKNNLAELGSLSMEFTRLAQLTYEPRYYDAVARITNALFEWQNRGTKLDGVFPDYVDASGCNRTSAMHTDLPLSQSDESQKEDLAKQSNPEGFVVDSVEKKPEKKDPNDFHGRHLEYQILPGDNSRAQILGWNDKDGVKASKRDVGSDSQPDQVPERSIGRERSRGPISSEALGPKDAESYDGVCDPQGLVSYKAEGQADNFHMGGGQDSTYEYFPKQYLLLGGLEEKYKKMYIKTMSTIRHWMLYRPMIPDTKRDILFSGSIQTAGDPEHDSVFQGQATHLTCFIGGMVGMASRIFDIEGDLEIAKQLTEGCIWAYESTPSGIMPEAATLLHCASVKDCPWNETMYWEYLDPSAAARDANLADYVAKKKEYAAQHAIAAGKPDKPADSAGTQKAEGNTADVAAKKDVNAASVKEPKAVQKRALVDSAESRAQSRSSKDSESPSKNEWALKGDRAYTKSALQDVGLGDTARRIDTTKRDDAQVSIADPLQPLSHEEFVKSRIQRENLPPGWISVPRRSYALRPEAIESVWYMYRLTGDTTWQDKGWKMYESIIAATSTEYGASSIMDAMLKKPYATDTMQSFWLAETLKYFYLLYEDPSVVSLDDWVLNTEAHPFRRPTATAPQKGDGAGGKQ